MHTVPLRHVTHGVLEMGGSPGLHESAGEGVGLSLGKKRLCRERDIYGVGESEERQLGVRG